LLLQAGANDMGFGKIVENCAYPPYDVEGKGDVLSCATDKYANSIANDIFDLETSHYARLKATLAAIPTLDGTRVYISEYHDPTHGADGGPCEEIRLLGAITDAAVGLVPAPDAPFLSPEAAKYAKDEAVKGALKALNLTDGEISRTEAVWAHDEVIVPLNQAVRRGATTNGWTFVPGLAEAFATHGYCADGHWVVRYDESKRRQVNHDGVLHPNHFGHEQMQKLLYARIAADFGLPAAPENADGGSGDSEAADAGTGGADGDAGDSAGVAGARDAGGGS
jgi:hypothetical protein